MTLLFISFGIILVFLGTYLIGIYNRLIVLRNENIKSFSNIDILMKQRADEIPEIVKVVQSTTQFEERVLTNLTNARTAFLGSREVSDRINSNNQINDALKTLFAVAENYPDLKSHQNFLHLQQRISDVEDKITDRRETFNGNVAQYNSAIEQFPHIIVAKSLQFTPYPFLDINKQEKEYAGTTL